MMRPRVLVFSSLFPSVARPRHGIFVETRLRHLMRDCAVDVRVIAPVPWFPFRSNVFGKYAELAATPRYATRDNGLKISHPRYRMIPRLGVPFQPESMARAALADVNALRQTGWTPDIIDAHYFYPDGVAAAILAEQLQIPFLITARGTDINVLAKLATTGRRIVWAARRAAGVVAVSTRLKEALVALGVEESHIVVLRNGVDLEAFRPEDTTAAREQLGLPKGHIAACVGNLLPEKGQSLAIEMLPLLPELHLVIVGDGPTRGELISLSHRLGVSPRVTFMPNMRQQELQTLYSSVDVLLLPSTREGWPNVVLESLACGTPVVATDVGAVGEMLTNPSVGRIVVGRDPTDFAHAVAEVLQSPSSGESIRLHAARFDWGSISRGQMEAFSRALQKVPSDAVGALAASS